MKTLLHAPLDKLGLDTNGVAVDQHLSDFDTPLAGVREVAFFPPMTGG